MGTTTTGMQLVRFFWSWFFFLILARVSWNILYICTGISGRQCFCSEIAGCSQELGCRHFNAYRVQWLYGQHPMFCSWLVLATGRCLLSFSLGFKLHTGCYELATRLPCGLHVAILRPVEPWCRSSMESLQHRSHWILVVLYHFQHILCLVPLALKQNKSQSFKSILGANENIVYICSRKCNVHCK